MKKIDKHFVSEIDQKLKAFDDTHEKSAAQQAEYDKYQRIYRLRDVTSVAPVKKEILWD